MPQWGCGRLYEVRKRFYGLSWLGVRFLGVNHGCFIWNVGLNNWVPRWGEGTSLSAFWNKHRTRFIVVRAEGNYGNKHLAIIN